MSDRDCNKYSSFKDMVLDSSDSSLYSKLKKNYFRLYLNKTNGMPMILSGKFKQYNNNMATFSCIRPFIEGVGKTRTITEHVNIPVKDFDGVIDLSTLIKNRKYYFICYCRPYSNMSGRYSVSLAKDITHNCIFITTEKKRMLTEELINKCFKFDFDELTDTLWNDE